MGFARSAASFARAFFTKSAETQDLTAARDELEHLIASITPESDPEGVREILGNISSQAQALLDDQREFYKNRIMRAGIETDNADTVQFLLDDLGIHPHGRIQYTRQTSHGEQVYACHSLLGHAIDVGAEDVALMLMEYDEVTPAQAMIDTAQSKGLTRAAAELASRFECV